MYAPAVRVITLVKGNLHPFVSAVFLPNDPLAVIPEKSIFLFDILGKEIHCPLLKMYCLTQV